jgi:hypothetical protein
MATWLVFLTGAYPLWRGWRANRHTSLYQAFYWAAAAWVAWGEMMYSSIRWGRMGTDGVAFSFMAVSLTSCAGVAVLGARRPGVGAWNFVVTGLLAVMVLPLIGGLLARVLSFDPLHVVFMSATLAVGILNYLPTRLAPAAVLAGAAGALELLGLTGAVDPGRALSWLPAALVPWAGFAGWRTRPAPRSEFDRVWLDFRDRFGFLWGQRMREQFNRSAANAGWPVILRWQGLRIIPGASLPDEAIQTAIVATLRALLKRFGEDGPPDSPT